ncbi:Cytochrome c oxidase assembly protein cox19 [Serendipita sp. 411]|nr:Cytochrome c oxidase assembly protein cox19 [Serendipita sp. 401]KAG8852631.1 Cytochrome c oxidase assembly protein cox19 [Serendipita sp. 411]
MSFGRPGAATLLNPTPPDRGSFPLDHEGECKEMMKTYLKCLKSNGNKGTACRTGAKAYLDCRMQRGLMDRDEWKNLGLGGVDDTPSTSAIDSDNKSSSKSGGQKT